MRVDVEKLRGKINTAGLTQEGIANTLDMDKSTFSRKMQGEALGFSVGEMHAISQILDLSKQEASEIFLGYDSHKCDIS